MKYYRIGDRINIEFRLSRVEGIDVCDLSLQRNVCYGFVIGNFELPVSADETGRPIFGPLASSVTASVDRSLN